jgi:deoxyribodipyrimidine photo-lyase
MQSGTTGINVTRVYNPIKQAQDHDQKGFFVRKWLPYMRHVPDTWLFEPWNMPQEVQNNIGIEVGKDIPQPIVDIAIATKISKERLYARRNLSEVRAGKKSVINKHASRAKRTDRKKSQVNTTEPSPQLTLEF